MEVKAFRLRQVVVTINADTRSHALIRPDGAWALCAAPSMLSPDIPPSGYNPMQGVASDGVVIIECP
jgi:hypothetical protein